MVLPGYPFVRDLFGLSVVLKRVDLIVFYTVLGVLPDSLRKAEQAAELDSTCKSSIQFYALPK